MIDYCLNILKLTNNLNYLWTYRMGNREVMRKTMAAKVVQSLPVKSTLP